MAYFGYHISPAYLYSNHLVYGPLPYTGGGYFYPLPVVGVPQPPVQPKPPRVPRRPISSPEIQLHPVLTSARSRMLHWLVNQDPAQAMNNPALNDVGPLPPHILNQAATSPKCNNMVLIFDDFHFQWTIPVQVQPGEFVSVKQILDAIYRALQAPLRPEEWDELSRNSKSNAHRSRCVRLSRLPPPPRFHVPPDTVAIRRADTLAEKIAFMGIERVGDPSNPSAWNVGLGYAADRDQLRRR